MDPTPTYLIEVIACSALFLAFYRFFLKRVDYTLARHYLVGAMLLALLIPALQLPLYPAAAPILQPSTLSASEPIAFEPVFEGVDPIAPTPLPHRFPWEEALAALYLIVTVALLLLFSWRIYTILRLRKRSIRTSTPNYEIAENEAVKAPFSFWRTIFIRPDHEPQERTLILCHEQSHIRHRHTLDRLVMELLRTLFWFNPCLWLAERWLTEVQEWQADADVIGGGADVKSYQATIFKQLFGYNPDIACSLSNSFTKKRFLMMTRLQHGKMPRWRFAVLLPLVAGLILAFGATAAEPDKKESNVVVQINDDSSLTITLNGKPISAEELQELGAEERIAIGDAYLQIADELDEKITKREYPSQSAYDKDMATLKSYWRSALAYYEKAGELTPNDRRTLSKMSIICFRLRDEEGMTQRARDYKKAIKELPADLVLTADKQLFFNDVPTTMETLPEAIADYRAWLENPHKAMVHITAAPSTTMGELTDVKEVLRQNKILRITYNTSQSGTPRILPPILREEAALTAAKRNVFLIFLDAKGEMSCGSVAQIKQQCSLKEMRDHLKLFLTNPNRSQELAEQTEQQITLPDGGQVTHPVSKGMLSISAMRDANVEAYMKLMQVVTDTYAEMRDEAAQTCFNRPMESLNKEEQEVIHRLVPIRLGENMAQVFKARVVSKE